MSVIDFQGTWTALVTPFDENGNIDYEGLRKNIGFQEKEGITGVLPVGTTGESPTLSEREHMEVVKRTKAFAGSGCGVLAGAGSNNTREALHYCETALEAGIDQVLLVDCYYNGPSSLELRDYYYRTILDELPDLKIVIYVIPGRTGTAISPVDIAVLCDEYDRVVAIKEATGDPARMEQEHALIPAVSIMSGDDDKTFEMMSSPKIAARGVISVTSNIAPGAVSEMVGALRRGDRKRAETLADKLKPLFSIVTVKAGSERTLKNGKKITVEDRFRNPLAIKTAMIALGMPAGLPRKPLGRMTPRGVQTVRDALGTVMKNSPEILMPIANAYGVDIEQRLGDDSVWSRLSRQ
jgi:4-hydroxy-tetrahydrodipicolinate synthase